MNYLYETNKSIEENKAFNQCEHRTSMIHALEVVLRHYTSTIHLCHLLQQYHHIL